MTLQNFTLGTFSQGAAGGGGAFESIATVNPSGVTTISFTSIPSTYQHLQIRGIYQGSTLDWLGIRVNSDTGSNYAFHALQANGAATSTQGSATQTRIDRITETPTSVTTSAWGVIVIDLHDYASTSKTKTFRSFGGWDKNGSGLISLASGLWNSTSAVTSITLLTGGQTYNSGTQFALYGIKGA